MQTIEIDLPDETDFSRFEVFVDKLIDCENLGVALRGTLKKYTGCIHWHITNGRVPGTLEFTSWPKGHRAWFSIQDGRKADWIDEKVGILLEAINVRHATT